MSNIITQIDIYLPEDLTTIEEDSFWRYLTWQDDKGELSKRIVTKFRPSALATAGYSDDNRPIEKTETPIQIGELEFLITTTPTRKNPSYSRINEEFGNYLNHLTEQHRNGLLRKGYRTIESEVYIDLSLLLEKLETDRKNLLEGKDGIRQNITLVNPEKLITEIPEHMSILLESPYETITEYNARMFVHARNMMIEGDKRTEGYKEGDGTKVKRFKELLLEDSLQRIGGEPTNPVGVGYAFDRFTFVHQLEPRKITTYASIINAFTKQMPQRLTKRSDIGDFALIEATMQDESLKAKLMGLGLMDDAFVRDYDTRKQDGIIYIRLQGVIDRLNKYREEFTSPSLEQNLTVKVTK